MGQLPHREASLPNWFCGCKATIFQAYLRGGRIAGKGADAGLEAQHLDGSHGGFGALVAVLATRAVPGLLQRIGGH